VEGAGIAGAPGGGGGGGGGGGCGGISLFQPSLAAYIGA
jgi:hypothetical protein